MFEVFKKRNGKRLFWSENRKLGYDEFAKGEQLVFNLSQKILAPNTALAEKVTRQVMQEWQSRIQDQTRRRSNTQRIRSPWGPDKIYLNQFHLLQNHAFKLLEDAELEQESKLKDNAESAAPIHPWTLILRYVKAVLLRTEQNSVRRLIGVGGVLHNYSPFEIEEIFTALWNINEDFADKAHSSYRDRDSVYYSQRMIEIFSERANRHSLNERFEPHAAGVDRAKVSHRFETLSDDHEVLDWIDDILSDDLCPWEVERVSSQTIRSENKFKRVLDLTALAIQPVLQSKNLDEFCAVDERRMRVITEPAQFSNLCRQVFDVKEVEMKKLSLPNLSGADSTRTPPPDKPGSINLKQNELWNEHQKTGVFRQRGWQAESLFVNVDENEPAKYFLDGKLRFNLSIPETANTVEVYLANETDKIFFYRLHLNWLPQSIADDWSEGFTAEGGQTIEFRLAPRIENESVSGFQFTVEYSEPFRWNIFRAFYNFAQHRTNPLLPIVAGGAAALIILLMFFAAQIFRNASPQQDARATVNTDEKKNQANSAPLGHVAVVSHDGANSQSDENGNNSDTADSSKSAPNINRREKTRSGNERQPKQRQPRISEPKLDAPFGPKQQFAQRRRDFGKISSEKLNENAVARTIEFEKDVVLPNALNLDSQRSASRKNDYYAEPNGTYVKSNRVAIVWSPIENALGYYVQLRDSNDRLIANGNVAKEIWSGVFNLKPNETYRWQAQPLAANGYLLRGSNGLQIKEIRAGVFSTLSAQSIKRVAEAEQKFSDASLDLAVVYLKNGLLDDAERELEAHLGVDSKSKKARRLLKQIEKLRTGR